jgi:hypothetical protein
MGRERTPWVPMYPKRQNFEPVGDQKITCRPRQGDSIFIGGAFTHRSYIFFKFSQTSNSKDVEDYLGFFGVVLLGRGRHCSLSQHILLRQTERERH